MFIIHLIGYISIFILAMQVIAFMMQGSIWGGVQTALWGWETYIRTVFNGVISLFRKNK